MVVRVPHYRRRIDGKLKEVSGYTRPERKGKKSIVDRKRAYYPVRDEFGQIKGYTRKKS